MLDSHTPSNVINYLTEEGIIIVPHPPYSSDLVPYDYWLNDCIKRNLTDHPNEKSLAHVVGIQDGQKYSRRIIILEKTELFINNYGAYFKRLVE